jgi:flavin reductase (DIM6/NTAB) family NADH-FMN oxidoreductase RutF
MAATDLTSESGVPTAHRMSTLEVDTVNATESFRHAMRRLPSGVSVITVGQGSDVSGLTVTSVSSLSIEPETVIFGINRKSSAWPILLRHGVFGVNVLNARQAEIAERFSGRGGVKGAGRYLGAKWMTKITGVRLLTDALAALDCEVDDIIERHSHDIVIGRVRYVHLSSNRSALAYWHGKYLEVTQNSGTGTIPDSVFSTT